MANDRLIEPEHGAKLRWARAAGTITLRTLPTPAPGKHVYGDLIRRSRSAMAPC